MDSIDQHNNRNGSRRPVFGGPVSGKSYCERPGSYAVVMDDESRIAVIETEDKTWFLPGGGIEASESDSTALQRELLEELGLTYAFDRAVLFGEAEEYIVGRDGIYYHVEARFYLITSFHLTDGRTDFTHKIKWVDAENAIAKMQRPGQAWTIKKALLVS